MPSVIGYNNKFLNGTLAASSEATGFEKENAFDWRTDDAWKPDSTGTHSITATFAAKVTGDYFAVYGHDLHTYSGTIQLQYSTDNGVTWQNASNLIAPTTSRVIFEVFPQQLADMWRVQVIAASGPPHLAVVMFGDRLDLPHAMRVGFSPPVYSRETEIQNSESEAGEFLGRSIIRQGSSGSIDLSNVDERWIAANWQAFVEHIELYPFFFSFDVTRYPDQAAFCFTDRNARTPAYSQYIRPGEHLMDASISFRARVK